MKTRTMMLLGVLLGVVTACGGPAWGQWEAGVLTDAATSKVEMRAGYELDEVWTLGLLGTWYAKDSPVDWGLGGYVKMSVDPNSTIALANWFPQIGQMLNLPETLQCRTYLIAKLEVLPYDDGVDLCISPGAGFAVGPFVVEYLYAIVESGDSDRPYTVSGSQLWFGACVTF